MRPERPLRPRPGVGSASAGSRRRSASLDLDVELLLGDLLDGLLAVGGRNRLRGLDLGHALGVDRTVGVGGERFLADPPAALGDASRLADAVTEVVELCPAHVPAGRDLERLDLGGMQREGSLDADAEGLLADGEGLADATALALDHDSLEDLGAGAAALDHLEVDANAVAGGELRATLQLLLLETLDDRAHVIALRLV